jgi:type II secretory pathway component PulJ
VRAAQAPPGDRRCEVTAHTGTLSAQSAFLAEIYERRRHTTGDADEEHHMRVAAHVLEKDLRIAVEVAAEHGLALPRAQLLTTRGRDVDLGGEDGR